MGYTSKTAEFGTGFGTTRETPLPNNSAKLNMPQETPGKKNKCKGICTDLQTETDITSSGSGWKSPSQLRQEVQTIIDIMGPPLSPTFYNNTSSEADNEESISNSKPSITKIKKNPCSEAQIQKTDTDELPTKQEANILLSTAADLNTTTPSVTTCNFTDSKMDFPFEEDVGFCDQYICPPPEIPANVYMNSECVCPQVANILQGKMNYIGAPKVEYKESDINGDKCYKNSNNVFTTWLKAIMSNSLENKQNCCEQEYYKMDVKKERGNDNSPPRRVVFELVKGLPKINEFYEAKQSDMLKTKKNLKNERIQTNPDLNRATTKQSLKKPIEKTVHSDSTGRTRVDVYYFDHGSFTHYQTTDAAPLMITEKAADRTEKYTTRFWVEIFGVIHVGFSFVTSFILQLLRFLLYSICRPLTIGLIQLCSDYFFKPLLATLFNAIIQPILIFIYNIISSIRDLCDPIAEGFGYFLREMAVLVRAFRIVEVINGNCKCETDCDCDRTNKRRKKAINGCKA